MKLKDLANVLNVSTRTIQGWNEKQLCNHGWKRVSKKRGKRTVTEYVLINENVTEENLTQMEQAKLKKLKADTKLVELRQVDEIKKYFDIWTDQFMEVYRKEFGPLKKALTEMRLDKKTADKINKAFEKCLNGLESGLKNITPVKNG